MKSFVSRYFWTAITPRMDFHKVKIYRPIYFNLWKYLSFIDRISKYAPLHKVRIFHLHHVLISFIISRCLWTAITPTGFLNGQWSLGILHARFADHYNMIIYNISFMLLIARTVHVVIQEKTITSFWWPTFKPWDHSTCTFRNSNDKIPGTNSLSSGVSSEWWRIHWSPSQ